MSGQLNEDFTERSRDFRPDSGSPGAPFDQSEQGLVFAWRLHTLMTGGYNDDAALELALHDEVDLHCACQLLKDGCPAETAVRILL